MRGRSRRAGAAGFSLMELMVVIILIALLAALALPTMGDARFDRHAYDDAGQLLEVARMARTRAVGRGGAVLLEITSDDSGSDRGQFRVWDAVRPNADLAIDGGVGGDNRTPVQSCKTPTSWVLDQTNPANASSIMVEQFQMNNTVEAQGDIRTTILGAYDPTGSTVVKAVYVCFTPLGRAYYAEGKPVFDASAIFNGGFQVLVYRNDASAPTRSLPGTGISRNARGPVRSVLIPSSGMPRLVSQ